MPSFRKIRIDKEYASLCPPLSEEELAQLQGSLQAEGCRDPLIVWKDHNILLDGHNRKKICDKEDISYRTVEVDLPDRAAARAFILHNQLGRRNLTPEAASYLRGRQYLEAKHQGKKIEDATGQNDQKKTTAQIIAEKYHVGEKTIRRDAEFADAVDGIVESCGDPCRGLLLSRQYDLKRTFIIYKLAKWSPPQQEAFFEELQRLGRPVRKKQERSSKRQRARATAKKIIDKGRDHALGVFKEMAKLLGIDLPKEMEVVGSES